MESQGSLGHRDRGRTCRILFAGKGYATWDAAVRQIILGLNPGKTAKDIEEGINKAGGYTSAQFLGGDLIVIVSGEPGNLAKITGRKAWLRWWSDTLPALTLNHGKVVMLISPNHEYDGWLRFVARTTGMDVSCRDDTAKPVASHRDYKELWNELKVKRKPTTREV